MPFCSHATATTEIYTLSLHTLFRSGADETIDHAAEDVRARMKEITGGRGADVVVETVGEATWKTSLEVAAQQGRIVAPQTTDRKSTRLNSSHSSISYADFCL